MNQLMSRLLLASVEQFVGLAAIIGGVGNSGRLRWLRPFTANPHH
jgi:hypothetical protein